MYVYLGVNRQKYVKENTQLNSTSKTKQEIYSRNGQRIEQDGSEGNKADWLIQPPGLIWWRELTPTNESFDFHSDAYTHTHTPHIDISVRMTAKEKKLNSTSYKRMYTRTRGQISFSTQECLLSERQGVTNVGEDGGKEHSHTIAGRNRVDTLWKTTWEFFKILQMECPSDAVILEDIGPCCSEVSVLSLPLAWDTVAKMWKESVYNKVEN